MDNKTYYYMKINKDFFDDDTVKYLEEQEHGKDFIILYLKLCLKSLEDEGLLIRYVGTKLIPYDTAAIAKMTYTEIEIVEMAMKIFEEIELIEKKETGELFMSQIQEMIGTDTYDARRKRKQRAKDKILNDKQTEKMGQCPTDVPNVSPNSPRDVPEYKSKSKSKSKSIEKELDKEIDIESEVEVDKVQAADNSHQKSMFNVFDYYQQRIGALDGYQYEQLKDYIDADGLEVELLKIAIDKSADNGKRTFGYVNAILNNWVKSGIKTVAQQQEEHRNWVDAKANKQSQQVTKSEQEDDGMDQYRNRTYSAEEMEEVERDLEEIFGKF